MKIVCIAQARMGSTRLPGKTMMQIKGKPLIGYLIERLKMVRDLDQIVIAIPKCDEGTSLHHYVADSGVTLFCGAKENDLVARFEGVISATGCDALIRICADSPLLDPEIIEGAVIALRAGHKFYSNAGAKYKAPGQSVEGTTTEFYREIAQKCDFADREHAGFPWVYREVEKRSLMVDTAADFERLRRTIEAMDRPHTDYRWMEAANLVKATELV
jgi:spore coat polysaccharide biosynthesis protein SpsF